MENGQVSGDANDAVVNMEDVPAARTDDGADPEQQRLHAYLVHLGDAQEKLDRANSKVAKAEEALKNAHAAVEEAERERAALEGRE